ncbi:MAG: hypothetical protein PF569_05445 [Candidatus Woesearchaeota archaeon]|jgi:hypothetical protein|nr:hypothetical protein [Candidatus Woesearchaeota archaeon]
MVKLTRVIFYSFLFLAIIFYFLVTVNFSEEKLTNVIDLKYETIDSYTTKHGGKFTYCIYADLENNEYRYRIDYGKESCIKGNLNNITYLYEKNILGIERREILEFHSLNK